MRDRDPETRLAAWKSIEGETVEASVLREAPPARVGDHEIELTPEVEVRTAPSRPLRLRIAAPFLWLARAFFTYKGSFVVLVALPSAAAIVYLVFLASDQYVAEARFAVRNAQFDVRNTKSDKVEISSSGAPAMAGQDAYVVASFVRSAAAFAGLPPEAQPKAVFTRPEADFWARMPERAKLEEVVDYWRTMVSAYVDGPSGVVTIRARAFRPEDARSLALGVIAGSEKLVNEMSARARADAMGHAEEEVRRTQGDVDKALEDERTFRDRQGVLDPASQASNTTTLLLEAMTQRIGLQAQYSVSARAMSPTAPTVLTMKSRLDALDAQIATLRSQLTSGDSSKATVSGMLGEFERLEIRRLFAEKLNRLAEDALERAREKVERQNVYLSVFVPPNLPEYPEFPQRFSLSLLIPVAFLAIWGILALISAAIQDHKY